jgi:siroheme synthase (precorrin-2 oxidase/ferrochelatase)
MIAAALDPVALPCAVAGRGRPALRRLLTLRSSGACDLLLFSDRPAQDLARSAGDALRAFLPSRIDLAALRALWVAGLPDERAAELATLARSERVLVNVED